MFVDNVWYLIFLWSFFLSEWEWATNTSHRWLIHRLRGYTWGLTHHSDTLQGPFRVLGLKRLNNLGLWTQQIVVLSLISSRWWGTIELAESPFLLSSPLTYLVFFNLDGFVVNDLVTNHGSPKHVLVGIPLWSRWFLMDNTTRFLSHEDIYTRREKLV